MEHVARAVIYVQDTKEEAIYSMKREKKRNGKLEMYYTFPGGHIDVGESPEQAVIREVKEELGIEVRIQKQLGHFYFEDIGREEIFFLCEHISGTVGTGKGEEWQNTDDRYGTYELVTLKVEELKAYPLVPEVVKEMLLQK